MTNHYCQDCGALLQPEYIPIGLCSCCLDITLEDENSIDDNVEVVDQQSFFTMDFDEDEY